MGFVSLIISYLIGSLSFGYLLCRLIKGKNFDIRKHGSGNTGTTNVLRILGPVPAILVLLLDVAKGVVPVLLATRLGLSDAYIMLSGFAAVAGHNWPVFYEFKGGRGVATSLGVVLGLNPLVFVIIFLTGITIIAITKYVSLASIIGSALFPLLLFAFNFSAVYIFLALILSIIVIWRHRENIKRLLAGNESKIGQKVKI